MFTCCECGGDKYNQTPVLLDYGRQKCCEECWEEVKKKALFAVGLYPSPATEDHAVLVQVFNSYVKGRYAASFKTVEDWCQYFHKTKEEMIIWIQKDHATYWSECYFSVTGKGWGGAP
jgi:hypothetical protein